MGVLLKHTKNVQRIASKLCFATGEIKVNMRLKIKCFWDVGIIITCPVKVELKKEAAMVQSDTYENVTNKVDEAYIAYDMCDLICLSSIDYTHGFHTTALKELFTLRDPAEPIWWVCASTLSCRHVRSAPPVGIVDLWSAYPFDRRRCLFCLLQTLGGDGCKNPYPSQIPLQSPYNPP